MKTYKILFFIIFFPILSYSKCRLKKSHDYLLLSGPLLTLLNELHLEQDPSIKAVTEFSHLKSFKVPRINGGVFLSKKVLKQYKKPIVFFDKSISLSKTLDHYNVKEKISLNTLSQDPLETIDYLLKMIKPYLEDCEKNVASFLNDVQKLKTKILNIKSVKKYLFFLGRLEKNKLPELIIGNDNIALFFKRYFSYGLNTKMNYLPISKKFLKNNPTIHLIGINSGIKKILKMSNVRWNISYPGALTPGYDQLKFIDYFLSNFGTSINEL